MKRLLLTLTVVTVSALTMHGQGRINFNNYSAGLQPTTVFPFSHAGGGATADFVGANYSVQLLWAAGTFANQAAFNAASPTVSPAFQYFGVTGNAGGGHGPLTDGSGLFDGGTIDMGGPAGVYTLQARAWFNTGFATFSAASSAGRNTGVSQLSVIAATASPTPAPDSAIPAFQVGIIPEPATLALAGLGAASLLLFRRRK